MSQKSRGGGACGKNVEKARKEGGNKKTKRINVKDVLHTYISDCLSSARIKKYHQTRYMVLDKHSKYAYLGIFFLYLRKQ